MKHLYKLAIAMIEIPRSLVTIFTLWFYDKFLYKYIIDLQFEYMQNIINNK